MFRRASLALLILLVQGCGKEQSTADFGLELRKPPAWTYVSGGVGGAQGDEVRYDAAALSKAIANHATAPLFALLKRAPPQKGMNPTFGLSLDRDAHTRGQTPLALLELRVKAASENGPFQVTEPVSVTRMAGLAAARAELRAPPQAAEPQTRVRLHLVVIDDVTLLMAATDAVSGDDEASAAFEQILGSVRFPGVRPAR